MKQEEYKEYPLRLPKPTNLRPTLEADVEVLSSPCNRYIIRRGELRNIQVDAIVHCTDRYIVKNTVAPPGFEKQLLRLIGTDIIRWIYSLGIQVHPHGLPVGEAIASPKFKLENCSYVIHTHAPAFKSRTTRRQAWYRQKLADCYRRCLEEALATGAKSIAFPCLGSGEQLRWEREEAAKIGLETVRRWFNHALYGKDRRKKIPGPIYFVSNPLDSYFHQEHAWNTAFRGIWPSLPESAPRHRIPAKRKVKIEGDDTIEDDRQGGGRGAMTVAHRYRYISPPPGKGGRPNKSDTSSEHKDDRIAPSLLPGKGGRPNKSDTSSEHEDDEIAPPLLPGKGGRPNESDTSSEYENDRKRRRL